MSKSNDHFSPAQLQMAAEMDRRAQPPPPPDLSMWTTRDGRSVLRDAFPGTNVVEAEPTGQARDQRKR